MTDHTPTTDVVRDACTFPRERLGEPRPINPEAFDRWLAEVKAEAWDEGHQTPRVRNPSGCDCGAWAGYECACGRWGNGKIITPNPHRNGGHR